jgi:AraC-like DNA-binding protein
MNVAHETGSAIRFVMPPAQPAQAGFVIVAEDFSPTDRSRAKTRFKRTTSSTAGYRVGYGTASHFTREHKRLFGAPPMRDMEHLRAGTRKRVGQGTV